MVAMTDDPLRLGDDWFRLSVKGGDPRGMEQHGPNMGVSIAAVTPGGETLAEHMGGAIIDTGAEVCCVSPAMFEKLKGGAEGMRNIGHVYGYVTGERTVRATVSWMPGVALPRDFSLLEHLAPYDVLIGRNILRECRFYLDIGAAAFHLYTKKPAEPSDENYKDPAIA